VEKYTGFYFLVTVPVTCEKGLKGKLSRYWLGEAQRFPGD